MTEPERALICLCGKKIANHSQEEIRACALKFMGESGEIVTSRFKNQPYCPCGKLYDDHTRFESIACGLAVQARVALELCPTCEKPIGQHTPDEIRACAHKHRDEKLKDVRCPICNKLVLEHSHGESVACTEKYNEQQRGEHGV